MRPATASFAAMASTVTLHAPGRRSLEAPLDTARAAFVEVERVASRFCPSSPLMDLHKNLGQWVEVPALLGEMLELAERCRQATGGLFDPRILPALSAAGYRGAEAGLRWPDGPPPDPWFEVGPAAGAATVRARLLHPADLGGMGKGFACDLAADLLRGALDSFVLDAGGDMRLEGPGDADDGLWTVGLAEPRDPAVVRAAARMRAPAAVATSSTAGGWLGPHGPAHHLIDPRTRRPSDNGIVAVTVAAGTAVAAEVWAKALLIAGPAALAGTEAWVFPVWWYGAAGSLCGNRAARGATGRPATAVDTPEPVPMARLARTDPA